MTKAFSILHRAAALLVALCLLVGMALPVYAAEDGALFFVLTQVRKRFRPFLPQTRQARV
jgi:hypothetical protein